MITIEKNRSRQSLVIAAVLAVAGGLAYWAFAPQGGEATSGGASGAASGMWPGWSSASQAAPGGAGGSILADARLSGLSAEDMSALETSLKGHPNPKAEAARIVSYLQYQRGFETWQTLDETKEAQKRREMAQALMKELPERLKAGEFTLIESALMGTVLLAEIESDEASRTQKVEAWQAMLSTLVPDFADENATVNRNKETEYMRRRATAFGDWQNSSDPVQRSPAKLEQAMEEIRREYVSGG